MIAVENTTLLKPTEPFQLTPELKLVIERVRLLARRRAAWLDFLQQEADISSDPLMDRDAPDREAQWLVNHVPELNDHLTAIENKLKGYTGSQLTYLAQVFGLSEIERDIFQICLALALDPTLESIFAYLHGQTDRPYITGELAARLLGLGRNLVWTKSSPLRVWQLVKVIQPDPSQPQVLVCDSHVRDWLLGSNDLPPILIGKTVLRSPVNPPDSWPIQRVTDFIQRVYSNGRGQPVWIEISGFSGSGRRTLAACAVSQFGLPLLAIDLETIQENEWEQVYMISQRQAFLESWALAWKGESLPAQTWPSHVPAFPVQFGIVQQGQALPTPPGRASISVQIPSLSIDERASLWRSAIPAVSAWPADELQQLASRFKVTPGEVKAIALQGIDSPTAAASSVRENQRKQLGNLAHRLDCPFSWSDLVISDTLQEALDDFVFEARDRVVFWEQPHAQRLFPQGRGLAALFTGPPGTGKTMATQVIAAELGLDLFRVDLSSVVSKYVGETSQNLEKILSRAENMDIVLFFDEADALFGKRTEIKDAHDRFANTDTNYLLQAIENYGGIVVLASNKKANIEPAFIRRLRYVLEFSAPDESQRLKIWKKIIAELSDEHTVIHLEPQLRMLAKELSLSGAQIKFSILAAAFAARRDGESLNLQHLLRGLELELMKEGRSLSEREKEKLQA